MHVKAHLRRITRYVNLRYINLPLLSDTNNMIEAAVAVAEVKGVMWCNHISVLLFAEREKTLDQSIPLLGVIRVGGGQWVKEM